MINNKIRFALSNPHPDLPPRGKELCTSFSPLGETGKGVI